MYSIQTNWVKNKINYHFFFTDYTTIKELCDAIIKKNHEWFQNNFIKEKFKKVWYENIITNQIIDENLIISKLCHTDVFKKISGENVKEIKYLEFKAILYQD